MANAADCFAVLEDNDVNIEVIRDLTKQMKIKKKTINEKSSKIS